MLVLAVPHLSDDCGRGPRGARRDADYVGDDYGGHAVTIWSLAVLAFSFSTPVTVTWLEGPARPVLVCHAQPGPCSPAWPAVSAPETCQAGPVVSGQWSPFGTSLTRADFSVVVEARQPLAAVTVVRPGQTSVAYSWMANGDGRTVVTYTNTNVAVTGTWEVTASDVGGCVVRVRGQR